MVDKWLAAIFLWDTSPNEMKAETEQVTVNLTIQHSRFKQMDIKP